MRALTAGIILGTKSLWDALHGALADLPVRILMELSEPGDMSVLLDKVERMRPEVLFLDAGLLEQSLEATIRAIRSTSANPAVLVLSEVAEPNLILRVMRAGAAEYLHLPFEDQMEAALERISQTREQSQTSRRGGQTIGFLSAKGGCGATTIACHTALEMPQHTKSKVLLADLDLDAGIIGFLVKSKSPYSIFDAVRNTQRLDENYWKALVTNGLVSGLETITAPPPAGREGVNAEHLRFVLSFVRTQYDWIVLDLGRSINSWNLGALQEIDQLMLVATLDVPALHQAKVLVQKLGERGFTRNRLHLVLNRAPKKFDITVGEIENMIGIPVYNTVPEDHAALNDCYSDGKLLTPQTNLGRHFSRLAMKIAGVEETKAKRRFSLLG